MADIRLHISAQSLVVLANSFLDTGIYPAVGEIIYKAPGVATMGIKFFIAIAQMILPFVLGATVATTAAGLTSYNTLFFGCGIIYIVLLVLGNAFSLFRMRIRRQREKKKD